MQVRFFAALREHPLAVAVTIAYLVIGVLYSILNPVHEATDELRHYRYVRYLADYLELPVQSGEVGNAQAHHPPLYYASAAALTFWARPADPLYEPPVNPHWSFRNWEVGTDNKNLYLHGPAESWPWRDYKLAAMLARWVTLLWGASAVALTYAMSHALLPGRKGIALTAAALVAFNGMYMYLGAAVNNDVPAGTAGAVITLLCLWLIRDGLTTRRAIWIGVVYGLANLVKFNLIAMIGVIGLALLLALLIRRVGNPAQESRISSENYHSHKLWRFAGALALILLIAALISGWWYLRNTLLYGEPTGFLRLTEIWGFREPGEGVALAWPELRYAWTSLWGRYGYGQIPLPTPFYAATAILCGLGLLGLITYLLRGWRFSSISRTQNAMLTLLGASAIGNFLVLFLYILVSPAGAMGRFFFPGLPALALLLAVGLLGNLPDKLHTPVALLVSGGLITFVLAALFGYIVPAYAYPRAIASTALPPLTRFGGVIEVLDYEVSAAETMRGGQVDVTLSLRALGPTELPYQLFVHLVNEQGVIVAQRDTYTGLGSYPSNFWEAGHHFSETVRVFIPETAYVPEATRVEIGFFHPETGRLPRDSGGDALALDPVQITADPTAVYPNETFINFENQFALLGYEIAPRVVAPGESVILTLYWQALAQPTADYGVFAQAIRDWSVVSSADSLPLLTPAQTSLWQTGGVYQESRMLTIPADAAPGMVELWVGWFDSQRRLNLIAPDGRILDDRLVLGNLLIQEASR